MFQANAAPSAKEAPFDFAMHLCERLGLSPELAHDLLAELVGGYEPTSRRPIRFSTLPANEY